MTLVFIVFLLIAAWLLLPGLLGANHQAIQSVEHSLEDRLLQLKQEFLFRSKELDQRLAAGDLAQEEWQKLSNELKLDTSQSIHATQQASRGGQNNTSKLMAIMILLIIAGLSAVNYYFTNGLEQASQREKIADLVQTFPGALDSLRQKAEDTQSEQAINELYLAHRTKVELFPGDVRAWQSLARFNTSYGRIEEAFKAMERALLLEPDNLGLQVDRAQILMSTDQIDDFQSAARLLEQILVIDPHQEDARMLLGFNAFSQGNFQLAIDAWSKTLQVREADSPAARMLERSIEAAKAKLQTSTNPPSPQVKTMESQLQVQISLTPSIQAQVQDDPVVYLIARAADGSKTPLAVVKTSVSALSQTVSVSTKDAMNADTTITDFDQILLVARISKNGNPIASPGDFEGQSEVISQPYPDTPVTITIDKMLE